MTNCALVVAHHDCKHIIACFGDDIKQEVYEEGHDLDDVLGDSRNTNVDIYEQLYYWEGEFEYWDDERKNVEDTITSTWRLATMADVKKFFINL